LIFDCWKIRIKKLSSLFEVNICRFLNHSILSNIIRDRLKWLRIRIALSCKTSHILWYPIFFLVEWSRMIKKTDFHVVLKHSLWLKKLFRDLLSEYDSLKQLTSKVSQGLPRKINNVYVMINAILLFFFIFLFAVIWTIFFFSFEFEYHIITKRSYPQSSPPPPPTLNFILPLFIHTKALWLICKHSLLLI